jgi:hypothetical protein
MHSKKTSACWLVIPALLIVLAGALGIGYKMCGNAIRDPHTLHLQEACQNVNDTSLMILMQSPEINADPTITKILNTCFAVWFNKHGSEKDGM